MATPQAIQLFYFDKKNKLNLNEEVFKILKDKNVSNKEVCVISIAGAFRQGKSFVMNFLKRYLEIKYKVKRRDLTKWLDPQDGPISGFSWQSGSSPHTTGILMWPEIFIAKFPQREVAIILIDTQGCFDNTRTRQESAVIFALSVLLSSVQIYNLKENIKQYNLEDLEFFSIYGQMVAHDSKDATFQATCQKLFFLIRDWSCPYEKKYGFEGGQLLLEEAFSTDGNRKELIDLKTNIKDIFTEISCCLLPYPGDKVACTDSFQGDVKDISPTFRAEVAAFVSTILAPEHLKPKTINHQILKVKNLIDLINICWKCFSKGDIPPLKSLYQATVEIHLKSATQEAEEMYKKLMEKCKTRNEAEKNKSKVLVFFREKKKMGSKSVKEEYEKQLIANLEDLFAKNYEDFIIDEEQRRSDMFVAGAATGSLSGAAAAGILVTGGISASAAAGEIILVATVAGLGVAASGFGIGVVVFMAVQGIRAALKKKESPAVAKSTNKGNERISEEKSVHQNEISSDGNREKITTNSNPKVNRRKVPKNSSWGGHREQIEDISSGSNPQREESETRYPHNRHMAQIQTEIHFSFGFNNWLIVVATLIVFLAWIFEWV